MLLDHTRTKAYYDAIMRCRDLFQGKIVLDVGCGLSCILTLFAVEAGAAHVYAVDAADDALNVRERILGDNGAADRVTLIRSKMEDLHFLSKGHPKVDIIISEWMGKNGQFVLLVRIHSSISQDIHWYSNLCWNRFWWLGIGFLRQVDSCSQSKLGCTWRPSQRAISWMRPYRIGAAQCMARTCQLCIR